METLTAHTMMATNMVDYWNKYRLDYLQEPKMLAMIDKEIKKYEDQVDHLLTLRTEIICGRVATQ
tara:strand:- start:451 stop:645 length:195 start_codon:yes stop_codon:yes gene_type:complete